MKIIVDAFGGDNAPLEIIHGAVMAAEEFDIEICLVGKEEVIRQIFKEKQYKMDKISIVDAPDVIEMCEDPVTAIRTKKNSSLVVGFNLLKEDAYDAFVSAGSTGAVLSGATLITKRINGIRRAALSPVLPTKKGTLVLIDTGANVECTAEFLLQFAYMGAYYASLVFGIEKPAVGLLNNGSEESKGTEVHKQAYQLLKAASEQGRINFVGNVEGKDALNGGIDVLVADGFSGNVFLKSVEGAASFFLSLMKDILMESAITKLAALTLKGGFKKLKIKLDPDTTGGAPLLGVAKPVIKAHGSSGARAFKNAIGEAVKIVKVRLTDKIKENIEFMKIGESND